MACKDLCEISQASASRIIKRQSKEVAHLKNNYITFPKGDVMDQLKLDFRRIYVFPSVVGAIDCTNIKISCPGLENGELFKIRKGYFSINVQGVCGRNLEILNMVTCLPGSVHNARVFINSRIFAQFERGDIPGILLRDSGIHAANI